MMGEALGFLSTLTSKGSDWPYILTQLYEGTNHTPLPKGKHLGIMPLRKGGEPMWADQPTQGPPALICQAVSHLPSGFKWG